MSDYLSIFLTFLKIGATNFGGGYAMLPLLQEEIVNKRHWASEEELLDYYAIGQCTPGIIAINVATFIGYKKKGIAGALCSTMGFISIPIVVILLIAVFLTNYAHLPIVRHAFAGIRVCVFVLILHAVEKLWKKSIIDKRTLGIFGVVLGLSLLSRWLPISIPVACLVIAAGLFGIIAGRQGGSSS